MTTGSLFDQIQEAGRKQLIRNSQPAWINPMLATLTHKHFSDPKWIFEPKLDGIRCLAFRRGREIRLFSRNKKKLNETYPELKEAIETQSRDHFVVDGEIVAFEGSVTSFSRLQGRSHITNVAEARRSPIKVYLLLVRSPVPGGPRHHASSTHGSKGSAKERAPLPRSAALYDPPQ
jgi:bifunctional non-homologous end joining protein LigD